MPVTYHPSRNIVDDDADILVNCVNCVGIMGKGVALAFAGRWPETLNTYREACMAGKLKPGGCLLFPLPGDPRRMWAALATKDHWRWPSHMDWVDRGLEQLAKEASAVGARSIAIPPPGCGAGGLDWRKVEPIVLQHISDFDLRVYGEKTT